MTVEKSQRLLGMLGFAMRAGRLIIGTEMVCKAMPQGAKAPKLVLVSESASDGTKKKITTKCEFYKIKSVQINMSTDEIGNLLGKTYSPAVIGITDDGFAREIEKLIVR
ncbi:MAG: ribosomal L7Ae/L30e/S12e/Gadd45 family protein [Clostridia bacterium]|nr:ribosomal L7Ae/L30e/S12e/Gadd45 family protein [Clostridia bacterium]